MKRVVRCALPVLLLAAAGCGGGDSEGSGDKPSGGDGGGKAVVVTTKEFPGFGTVLANEAGRPLYVLSSDPKGGSKCADSCAQSWPPVSGQPSADGDVDEGKLSTFTREDGSTQVLYNGHALYTNTGEALAGIGSKSLGGSWYLVSPKGEPVKNTEAGGY
jgi:predicted lipoprotein with Yx(FWY)xxD motif